MLRLSKLSQTAPCVHERFLRCLLCLHGVAKHRRRNGEHMASLLANDSRECVPVPALSGLNVCVRRTHGHLRLQVGEGRER